MHTIPIVLIEEMNKPAQFVSIAQKIITDKAEQHWANSRIIDMTGGYLATAGTTARQVIILDQNEDIINVLQMAAEQPEALKKALQVIDCITSPEVFNNYRFMFNRDDDKLKKAALYIRMSHACSGKLAYDKHGNFIATFQRVLIDGGRIGFAIDDFADWTARTEVHIEQLTNKLDFRTNWTGHNHILFYVPQFQHPKDEIRYRTKHLFTSDTYADTIDTLKAIKEDMSEDATIHICAPDLRAYSEPVTMSDIIVKMANIGQIMGRCVWTV